MYYVRKFSKPTSVNKLRALSDVNDLESDFLSQELRTSGNTLSFWKCEGPEQLEDTVNTILLSTNKIETSQFIMIDESYLTESRIEIDHTKPGKTGYKNHADLHVDFCCLTYQKIGEIVGILKKVAASEDKMPKYERGKIKEILCRLHKDGLIDLDNTDEHLRSDIIKYSQQTA